jgi:hypothetical protein
MSVNEVTICNSALIKLGADRISSLTQDSKAAILCNSLYEMSRKAVLTVGKWRFAIARAQLTLLSETPLYEYDYMFQMPTDCLQPFELATATDMDGTEDLDYTVEADKLLCDESVLYMRYVKNVNDPNAFHPLFAEAFAWYLAWQMAIALTGSAATAEAMNKGFQSTLSLARSMNAMIGTIKPLIIESWTKSRL